MSSEQLPETGYRYLSCVEYADQTWYDELVRMQNNNSWTSEPIFLNGLYQEHYADSLVSRLREKPYFQKFGGKTLEILMVPSYEPYMVNIGLKVVS